MVLATIVLTVVLLIKIYSYIRWWKRSSSSYTPDKSSWSSTSSQGKSFFCPTSFGMIFPKIYFLFFLLLEQKGIYAFFSDFYSHTLRCQSGGEDVTAPLNICPSKWDKNIPFIDERPKNISNSRIWLFVRTWFMNVPEIWFSLSLKHSRLEIQLFVGWPK